MYKNNPCRAMCKNTPCRAMYKNTPCRAIAKVASNFVKHYFLHECLYSYAKVNSTMALCSIYVYILLAHGQWFSPGTPASSTTKTGRHDIAEILLKVALKKNQIYIYICNEHLILNHIGLTLNNNKSINQSIDTVVI